MDLVDSINWRYAIYAAIVGPIALWLVKKQIGKAPDGLARALGRLGLAPVESGDGGSVGKALSPRGARFRGTYKGFAAGYNQGAGAFVRRRIGTRAGALAVGTEFWVGEDLPATKLVIHEYGDRTIHETDVIIPEQVVPTGDPTFDARFRVCCDHWTWARAVVDPNVRAWLVHAPVPALVVMEGRVVYPLLRPTTPPGLLVDRPDIFLDTAGNLAHAIRAYDRTLGRPTDPGAPEELGRVA